MTFNELGCYLILPMGRKQKYHTPNAKQEAQRRWQMEYYYRNKEDILQKAMEKYRKKKLAESRKRRKNIYDE